MQFVAIVQILAITRTNLQFHLLYKAQINKNKGEFIYLYIKNMMH